jgi:hypothetical protein
VLTANAEDAEDFAEGAVKDDQNGGQTPTTVTTPVSPARLSPVRMRATQVSSLRSLLRALRVPVVKYSISALAFSALK